MPISAGSPCQNGFAERLIGTFRRERVDHLVVLGGAHLRRVLIKFATYYLIKFATYYNERRIHRSLNNDAPFHRAIERVGAITSRPIIGGLHHQYCRALTFSTLDEVLGTHRDVVRCKTAVICCTSATPSGLDF